MHVPSQTSERSFICLLGAYISHMFLRFSVIFLNCSDGVGYFAIPHSWLIIWYFKWTAQRVQLMKQEMDSSLICIGGSSCSICVLLCNVLLNIVFVSFDNYIVCPSSTYCFWVPLWYLQYLLSRLKYCTINLINNCTIMCIFFFSDALLLLWSNVTDTSCRCLTRKKKKRS